MKNFYLTLIGCCLVILLQAQVSRTLEVSPGKLESLLSPSELLTITDLTLTGTIDARDFQTMRTRMPVLSVLDIRQIYIAAFSQELYAVDYPANTIPLSDAGYPSEYDYSFSNKTSLTSVILPATLTAIGSQAFRGCTGLLSVEFPTSLTTIEGGAFADCTALRAVSLPSSLWLMGWEVFYNCSSLVSVEFAPGISMISRSAFGECTALKSIVLPSSVMEINEYAFYDCTSLENVELSSSLVTIGSSSFARCRSLTSVIFPSSVKTIGMAAFTACTRLSKVVIPRTLQHLEPGAFAECGSLTSVYVFHTTPLEFYISATGVFENVDKANCTLYVPASTRELYASAAQWKDFQHIVEMPLFELSATRITMQPDQQTASFGITTLGAWTAQSDQPWLTVSPLSGTGTETIALTAENNISPSSRTAIISVSIADTLFQTISIMQKGVPVEIDVTAAGSLPELIKGTAVQNISELVLTGQIDARDFKFIRDQMPSLEILDVRPTTIQAYSGYEGTYSLDTYDYPENEVPPFSLEDIYHVIPRKLTAVYLPESATSIAREALAYSRTLQEVILPHSLISMDFRAIGQCASLTDIEIPSSVTTIGSQVFSGSSSLTTLALPASITELGRQAFEDCIQLTAVKLPPLITAIREKTFYNCFALTAVEFNSALTLIDKEAFYNCIKLDSVMLPPSVTAIQSSAFALCKGMTTISIPASVKNIGNNAFTNCKGLQSFYSHVADPASIALGYQVFMDADQEHCILYVPAGSKSRYAAASQWNQFKHIVEMEPLNVSATTAVLEAAEGSSAEILILSNADCSVISDQPWLMVTYTKGPAQQTITLTAQANTAATQRSALVTISAPGFTSTTINVSQRSMTVGTAEELSATAQLKYYPNPFTSEMTIEVENPSLKEVTVEFFSMSGQKIITLLKAQKGQKISCTWKGDDGQGKQMPAGMYLVKVNGMMRKVMKE